jgi:hypothetical protein
LRTLADRCGWRIGKLLRCTSRKARQDYVQHGEHLVTMTNLSINLKISGNDTLCEVNIAVVNFKGWLPWNLQWAVGDLFKVLVAKTTIRDGFVVMHRILAAQFYVQRKSPTHAQTLDVVSTVPRL